MDYLEPQFSFSRGSPISQKALAVRLRILVTLPGAYRSVHRGFPVLLPGLALGTSDPGHRSDRVGQAERRTRSASWGAVLRPSAPAVEITRPGNHG